MGFLSRYFFITIPYCLTLVVTQSCGELAVLYDTDDETNPWTTELTCISEDDGAALIWNYNPDSPPVNIGDLQPERLATENVADCATLDSSKCLDKWIDTDDWRVVNSATKPTGPVFDHRWEGFREFGFGGATPDQSYQYVSKIADSAGILWFSARGLHNLSVYLCERQQSQDGPCLSILISGSRGRRSAITYHADVVVEYEISSHHDPGDIIDLYEWRTFRVEWNVTKKTIEVFKGSDSEPFLSGMVPQLHALSHVLVRSDTSSLVRFHFYDYFLTETKNAVISTEGIEHSGKMFCAELSIGLCPKCKVNIYLLDEDGHNIKTWNIVGDEHDQYSGLLSWQVAKLNTTLDSAGSRSLKFTITSIIDEGMAMGQWAIDNFRMCGSGANQREARITLNKSNADRVTCQKLSYPGNTILKSVSLDKPDRIKLQSRNFIHHRKKRDPDDEAPSMVENLAIVSIGTTNVTLMWNSPSDTESEEIINYRIQVTLIERQGCRDLDRMTPSEEPIVEDTTNTTICVQNLHPYANYKAVVTALNSERESPNEITFQTNQTNIPTAIVSRLRISEDENSIEWDTPEDCTTISGWTTTIKLIIMKKNLPVYAGQTKKETYPVKMCKLLPYTTYTVRAHIMRNYSESWNETAYQSITWRTRPAAPSPVGNLILYDADPDTNTVSLQWLPPDPANGVLQSYVLSVTTDFVKRYEASSDSSINDSRWKLRKDVIRYEDLELLTNATEIRVHAVNKDVEEPGNLTVISINQQIYDAEPSEPEEVLIAKQTLKWKRPELSPTRIKNYIITVNSLTTDFLASEIDSSEEIIEHPATQDEEEYDLNRLPSRAYKISIAAENQRGGRSRLVPVHFGFDPDDDLEVESHGASIRLKVPAVMNATQNTWINVTVNGLMTCEEKHSSSPPTPMEMVEWNAARYKVENRSHKWLYIGAHHDHNVKWDCSFQFGETYEIVVRLENEDLPSGLWTERMCSILLVADTQFVWLAAILPIIAVCLFVLFVWYRKRRTVQMKERGLRMSCAQILPASSPDMSTDPCALEDSTPQPKGVANEPDPCCISVNLFGNYAKQSAASGLLTSQFMLLPVGPTRSCEYGSLPENRAKNRRSNLIAYDKTRVVLEKIPGDPYYDYINASYVRGYRQERTYIATQGPMANTVNDFWRMIWQEDVRVICMLVNVVEGSVTLCEKYWPDVFKASKYGDILVSNTCQQIFADYTVRTFKLSYKLETRRVTHLHYTGWPNVGVPACPQALVAYLEKLRDIITGDGPVVMHCHMGDDRAGTIILTDVCLRQASETQVIDVTAAITRMRDDRANMVATPQQYLLAHILVAESLVSQMRQIPCNNQLPSRIEKLKMQVESDLQILNESIWQERALRSLAAPHHPTPEVPVKPFLPTENSDNPIGAVSVDGVRVKGQYLASWLPTPLSLNHFWRFVVEKNTKLIIILQCSDPKDPSCHDIIPDESTFLPMPRMEVRSVSDPDGDEHFNTDRILLTDTSEDNARLQSITVLTCREWGAGGKPPGSKTLVALWKASENISPNSGETLVLCHDGITGCGLYLAMSLLLERMAVDRVCDIFSAVRAVRQSRHQFVRTEEEFVYLYDAAVAYAESFDIYSN